MKTRDSIKTIICFFILCLSSLQVSAQDYGKTEKIGFEKHDIDISFGIGLMPTFVDKNTRAALPPVNMTFTYRVKKHIAIASYFAYSATDYIMPQATKEQAENPISLRNNFYVAGLRAEGHFVRDRIDFYGGGMLGYTFSSKNNVQADPTGRIENIQVDHFSDQITWSGLIGVKYLVSPKVGLYGEMCYGVSLFNAGITFKL